MGLDFTIIAKNWDDLLWGRTTQGEVGGLLLTVLVALAAGTLSLVLGIGLVLAGWLGPRWLRTVLTFLAEIFLFTVAVYFVHWSGLSWAAQGLALIPTRSPQGGGSALGFTQFRICLKQIKIFMRLKWDLDDKGGGAYVDVVVTGTKSGVVAETWGKAPESKSGHSLTISNKSGEPLFTLK